MLGIKSGNGVNFRFPSPYPRLCREGLKRKEMKSKRFNDQGAFEKIKKKGLQIVE